MIHNAAMRAKLARFNHNYKGMLSKTKARNLIKQDSCGFKVFNKTNELAKHIMIEKSK